MVNQAKRSVSIAIILMLGASGLLLLASPVRAEDRGTLYSRDLSTNELNLGIGYARPYSFATARFDVGGDVSVVITVLLGTLTTEVLRSDFPAGVFEVSGVSLGTGGTVFLSVQSVSGSHIQMSVDAWVFRLIATYPYSWAGLVVLVFAGLFALATQFPNTSFGKVAGWILPVHKLGL